MINNLVGASSQLSASTGLKREFTKSDNENVDKKTFSDELKSKSRDVESASRDKSRSPSAESAAPASTSKKKDEPVSKNLNAKKESTSEKPEERSERVESSKNKVGIKKSLAPEEIVAISNFMASIESELEIPPKKMMEAMATSEVQGGPKGSVETLLKSLSDKLNLNAEQSLKLEQLGETHLQTRFQTAEALQQKMSLASMTFGKEIFTQVQSPDKHSNLEAKLAQAGLLASSEASSKSTLLATEGLKTTSTSSVLQMSQPQLMNSLQQMNERFWMKSDSDALIPQDQAGIKTNLAEGRLATALMSPSELMKNSENSGSDLWSDQQQMPKEWSPEQPNILNSHMSSPVDGEINFFNRSLGHEVDEKEKMLLDKLDRLAELSSGGLIMMGKDGQIVGLNEMKLNQGITESQKAENVQKLLSESSYLVKNGGGEMKVKLHPEGFGELDLKVILRDGKVQLEMVTESKEAKKILDSQIADLKLGLAAQKLSVELIKIDHVNATNTDQSTQLFSNLNSQQGQSQQQELRQMWAQMNDFGSQARKSSYFEMMTPKNTSTKESLQAAPSSASAKSAYRHDGRGRGVNLVA